MLDHETLAQLVDGLAVSLAADEKREPVREQSEDASVLLRDRPAIRLKPLRRLEAEEAGFQTIFYTNEEDSKL